MELKEAIVYRRSVRKFTDYYVTDDDIRELIDAAHNAPSWANTQVWEFIVVRERELITAVTETYSPTNPARAGSTDASAIIVVCAKTKVSGCKEGKERTKFHEWFLFDLGMAVQNLCLKAHEMGLGTVVVGAMDHDACAKVLQVPEGIEVVVALPLGRPAAPSGKGPSRKELRSCVYLDSFGEQYGKVY
jgi:nitroreductase